MTDRHEVRLFEGRQIDSQFFLDHHGPQAVLRVQLRSSQSNGYTALLEGRMANRHSMSTDNGLQTVARLIRTSVLGDTLFELTDPLLTATHCAQDLCSSVFICGSKEFA